MNPCHIDILWQNDTTPAINETNLGQINTELKEIDTRVCALANDPAGEALVSEGYAVGTQEGTPVSSGSPYFENNSKYYCHESEAWAAGTIGGVPVSSGADQYENNAKHYADEAADLVADLLQNYGVSVVGTQLVFGVEFEDSFSIAVVGTQLQISNLS